MKLDSDSLLKCRRCPATHPSRVIISETKNLLVFPCGHIRTEYLTKTGEIKLTMADEREASKKRLHSDSSDYSSFDGKKFAYEYQQEGVKFLEKCGGSALIADEPGLGKTLQALLFHRRHKELTTPILFTVKAATKMQWGREFHIWANPLPMTVMPISELAHILPGFTAYIISHDMLGAKGVLDRLKKLNLKCIVVDESQAFKDPRSLRTKSLINLIQESRIEKRIFLSGTPIKSRASEYFTILNLIDPRRFASLANFKSIWLDDDGNRIAPYMLDKFREVTAQYIIRRNKEDVLKDLPELSRYKQYVEIESSDMRSRYNSKLDLFANLLNMTGSDALSGIQILAELAKIRQETALMKLQAAQEWINAFFESNPVKKLIVGIHHKNVRDALHFANRENSIMLSGEDTDKDPKIQQFINDPTKTLLIMNMLACGVGVDGLQRVCSDMMTLERCWTPPDEEQFEGRLLRIGQEFPVSNTYLMAAGTFDQFFDDLIENKREVLGETLDGWDITSDFEGLRSFAELVVGRKL